MPKTPQAAPDPDREPPPQPTPPPESGNALSDIEIEAYRAKLRARYHEP
ncbi:hypothetical protein ACWDSJ_09525 [Nocardia sp. NPDC003482]